MTKWTSQLSTWIMTTEHEATPKPPGASASRLPEGTARWRVSHVYRDGQFYGTKISFYDEAGNLLGEGTY